MSLSPKKAKEHCGYDPKPVPRACGSCGAFAVDIELPDWCKKENERHADVPRYSPYTAERHGIEKNLRCTDHGFATKKKATCRLWRPITLTKSQ